MSQPPQDRPDYPWGPSDADRGATRAEGGSTRLGGSSEPAGGPDQGTPPAGPSSTGTPYSGSPYSGTPYSGSPSSGAPYTGTPVSQLPPLGPPGEGRYAGGAPERRDGAAASTPVSTIVLLVLSGLVLLVTLASFVGIVFAAPVALAVVALTRQSSDPDSARRLTRIGWWVFAGLLLLGAVLIAVGVALLVAFSTSVGGYGDLDQFGATSTTLAALLGAAR